CPRHSILVLGDVSRTPLDPSQHSGHPHLCPGERRPRCCHGRRDCNIFRLCSALHFRTPPPRGGLFRQAFLRPIHLPHREGSGRNVDCCSHLYRIRWHFHPFRRSGEP